MEEKILVIEDDKQIARFVELELIHEGYQVEVLGDGSSGIDKLKDDKFSLVLLDIMLPGIDGIATCNEIRKFSQVPIIMVTARDDIEDKVEGLDMGADDYITKPFAIEELLARIRALLRRKEPAEEKNILRADNLRMDLDKHQVQRNNEEIELTKKEFDLLHYLLINEGIVNTREKLLSNVWGYDYSGETNIVDVYIRYLRSKIDEPFANKLIHTVRGVGYVLREDNL